MQEVQERGLPTAQRAPTKSPSKPSQSTWQETPVDSAGILL